MQLDKRFLFRFTEKVSLLRSLYYQKRVKYGDSDFEEHIRIIRNLHYGWSDVVPNKTFFNAPSALVGWMRFIMPYGYWLRILEWVRIGPIRAIDRLFLNILFVLRIILGRVEVAFYIGQEIYGSVESLLSWMNVCIIEYEGRAAVSVRRDLRSEVHCSNKYLVSNMDFRPRLGHRKSHFRQLLLGVDETVYSPPAFESRDIDVLVVGSFHSKFFRERCEFVEALHLTTHNAELNQGIG